MIGQIHKIRTNFKSLTEVLRLLSSACASAGNVACTTEEALDPPVPRTNVSRLVFHRHARLQFHAVHLGINLNVASAIACSASTHAACTTRVKPGWRLLCIRDEVGPNAFIEHVSMLAFKILECKLVTVSRARQGTASDICDDVCATLFLGALEGLQLERGAVPSFDSTIPVALVLRSTRT